MLIVLSPSNLKLAHGSVTNTGSISVARNGIVTGNQLFRAFGNFIYEVAITSADNFTVKGNSPLGNFSFISTASRALGYQVVQTLSLILVLFHSLSRSLQQIFCPILSVSAMATS